MVDHAERENSQPEGADALSPRREVGRVKEVTFEDLAKGRGNNFDLLRFLLATLVLVSHSRIAMAGPPILANQEKGNYWFLGMGGFAVDWFFTISGFLIAASWFRSGGVWDYTKKRALRIYPGLITCLLLCILVVGPLGGANLQGYWTNPATWKSLEPLAFHSVMPLPGVFSGMRYPGVANGPVWSIRFEILCYVGLALLGLVGLLRRKWTVVLVFLAAFCAFNAQILGHLATSSISHADSPVPRLASFFLCGTLFFLYRNRIPYRDSYGVISGIGLLASFFFLPSLGVPLFGSYLCFYLAYNQRIKVHRWGRFGDFSYGMYLYAWPCEMVLLYHFAPYLPTSVPLADTIIFIWTFVSALACSVLSWKLVESPFLRMKGRRAVAPPDAPEAQHSAQSTAPKLDGQ